MANNFIDSLCKQLPLAPEETTVLEAADVRTFQDLDSLVRNYPSLSKLGVRVPLLSNLAVQRSGAGFAKLAAALSVPQTRRPVARGARHPAAAQWALGSTVPLVAPPPPPAAPPSGAIDLRVSPWPIRDQGSRGTCVAFASSACAEFRGYAPPGPAHLSEQFLYWAIKTNTNDPNPAQDGTFLEFSRDALTADGICGQALWPYVKMPVAGNVSQGGGGNPTAVAITAAAGNCCPTTNYGLFSAPGGGAAAVLGGLRSGRPVAITVPVFTDPLVPGGPDNWTTASGWTYGKVLNPPPTAAATDGHAVCVTGFVPDAAEPKGGYFIFRNSWDVLWGSASPSSGNSNAPEPGYGEISASYVDNYLWELLQL